MCKREIPTMPQPCEHYLQSFIIQSEVEYVLQGCIPLRKAQKPFLETITEATPLNATAPVLGPTGRHAFTFNA